MDRLLDSPKQGANPMVSGKLELIKAKITVHDNDSY